MTTPDNVTQKATHTRDEIAPGGLKRMADVWHPDLPIQINWTWELDGGCSANIFCPGNSTPWRMARIEVGSRTAAEAYARLVGAAPDLLAAARRAKELLKPEVTKEPDRTIFWELVAAIQKATGGTP